MNRLVNVYETRRRKDESDLVEMTVKAEAEAKAARKQRSKANKLAKKCAELEAALLEEREGFAAEKEEWESSAQAYREKIGLLSRHIRSVRMRDDSRLCLSQVKATIGCLKRMAEDGSSFADRLKQLNGDIKLYKDRLAAIPDVPCAEDELEFFPELDPAV